MPTGRVARTRRPTSSKVSRSAACGTVSPRSMYPPGKTQRPQAGSMARRASKIRPFSTGTVQAEILGSR